MPNFLTHLVKPPLFLLFIGLFHPVLAAVQTITVTEAWARASLLPNRPSAAYIVINNHSPQSVTLLSAKSPVAGDISIHQSRMENGMMKMEAVSELSIPAHGKVKLQPGGLHLMLMQLKAPLLEGSSFPITLHFRNENALTLEVPVESVLNR